jgi:transposase
MKRFIEGEDRSQVTLLPDCLDDYIGQDNPVRVVDAFVEELELRDLGFESAEPAVTGRPSYHPAVLLKIYIYATSTAFSPAAAWSARRSATSS